MSKPQIVVIPGAWHAPFYMDDANSKLEALGYIVHARNMPAVGSKNPCKDLSDDIAATRALVEEAIGSSGNDVVIICHSWGGIVTGTSLQGLSKQEREAAGQKGGVTRVGYMAAFIVPEGVSLMDAIGGVAPPWFDLQEPFVYAMDPNMFYNDLPTEQQKSLHAKLQSHNYNTFLAKTTAASWRTIPTSYLLCEDDLAIPMAGQEAMIKGVQDAGAQIEVRRIKAGHSPFLSKVGETVEWIEEVARKGV